MIDNGFLLYPKHNFGCKDSIFIGKTVCAAIFFGNVAYRLDSNPVSGTL